MMAKKSPLKDSLIDPGDCALVIIDVQEKLMPVIANKEKVLENVLRLARFSKILGIPVVITEQDRLGPTLVEVQKELSYVEPAKKVHFNCFHCEPFRDAVAKTGKGTIVLAGVEAHICVAQTALYGLTDFAVHVVGDAVSSRTVENLNAAVERIRQAGAVISSTEMFIYEVLRKAGTDAFKAALQLVK
jgi:nicotinamidase-related amidase